MMKCRNMSESIAFYTNILDFQHVDTWPKSGSPSFSILLYDTSELHLSTHSGDGVEGTVVSIIIDDAESLFKKYISRGLKPTKREESPVHQGPIRQTWGSTEFYVDDPNGNTLRFIE
jgi:catechol 2,3-dioxygenase-like lactoylglutathione lyase family enzyme